VPGAVPGFNRPDLAAGNGRMDPPQRPGPLQ
jgi:hypothetical protein